MNIEQILEDVMEEDNSLVIRDEIIPYKSSDFEESVEDMSKHQVSSLKHKLSKIIKLNKTLNKFGSGFVDKETGKLNSDIHVDLEHLYHYLSPEEFERAKGGVCWDYAEYQYRVLKKTGFTVINLYLEFDDPMSCNHAFTVVKFKDFYIYLESSFKKICGVRFANHIRDIFTFVINSIANTYKLKNVNYEIHSYSGYDNYGCDVHTFMDHMMNEEKLIAKGRILHNQTLSTSDIRRFDEAVEDDGNESIRREMLNDKSSIPEKYKKHLRLTSDDTGVVYYNKSNNDMIGFINTEKKDNDIWIQALEVDSKYRRNGYGKKLMEDAIKTYHAKYLSVRKTNNAAISLYKSMGFKIIDETDYMYAMSTSGKHEKCFSESDDEVSTALDDFVEGYIISDKDIYYNKEKFDSGEINICFIIGHMGSGKSTMGRNMQNSIKAEHYEIDDVIANFNFSDENLKEYGSLISSFFTCAGKPYRISDRSIMKEWSDDERKKYIQNTVTAFIDYSISYAKQNVNTKYVIEGIQIFLYEKPNKFDDCAFYIKGTSALKSYYRALVRNYKENKNNTNENHITKKEFIMWSLHNLMDTAKFEKDVRLFRKYFQDKSKDFSESAQEIGTDFLVLEEAIEHSFLLKGGVEKNIFSVLDTPEGRRKYKRIQDEYINRNIEKLSTAGPMYLIVFGDNDQKAYFDLFGIKKEEIIEIMKNITQKTGANSDFKFLRQNPILVILYFCIRYFTLKKDEQGLNATLGIFSLGIYWSKFTKYFPKGVIGPVMDYTIDNMTEKFMVKKCGNIFNTLMTSIRQSYQFHKKRFYEGGDDDVVAFLQRISNDQNSLLKKIANEYMRNWKEGKSVTTRNDDYDPDNPIVDDVQNASTIIQNQVTKVTLPIISNGVDLVLAEASARMSKISVSDCREYLMKIMVQSNLPTLESLIESILFMFIYTQKKSIRDIKSQYFLVWSQALFRKTNSKDENLRNINKILEKWAEESGIYARYKREGSRINYKKAIFFYVILSIQKYS